MEAHEIQAKAALAAALIAVGDYKLGMAHAWASDPSKNPLLTQLRDSVNVIYRVLTNPPY